jgi:hypothetical protein
MCTRKGECNLRYLWWLRHAHPVRSLVYSQGRERFVRLRFPPALSSSQRSTGSAPVMGRRRRKRGRERAHRVVDRAEAAERDA